MNLARARSRVPWPVCLSFSGPSGHRINSMVISKLGTQELNHSQNHADPDSKGCIEYRVTGLPDGTEMRIGRFSDNDWRVLYPDARTWSGSYSTPDEALAEIQKQYD